MRKLKELKRVWMLSSCSIKNQAIICLSVRNTFWKFSLLFALILFISWTNGFRGSFQRIKGSLKIERNKIMVSMIGIFLFISLKIRKARCLPVFSNLRANS